MASFSKGKEKRKKRIKENPTQRHHIHHHQPVLQRHQLEVQRLHPRPQQPVGAQRAHVRRVELGARIAPLHHAHGRQEHEQVRRREDALVEADARGNLGVGAPGAQLHLFLQEAEPLAGRRPKDGWKQKMIKWKR